MNKALRKRRQKLGLSQVQIATLTGMSNGTISDFELGKREPWPKAREALARALDTTEVDLFPSKGVKNA